MKNKDEVESFFHTKIANHLFENGTKYVILKGRHMLRQHETKNNHVTYF